MAKMDNRTFFAGMDLVYSSSPVAYTGFVMDVYNTSLFHLFKFEHAGSYGFYNTQYDPVN